MSIVKSVIESVQAAFSNKAYEQIQIGQMREELMSALKKASEDGTVTAEEIQEIVALVQKLELNHSELAHIRILMMRDLVNHLTDDHVVGEDEMALFKEISANVVFKGSEEGALKEEFDKLAQIYKSKLHLE